MNIVLLLNSRFYLFSSLNFHLLFFPYTLVDCVIIIKKELNVILESDWSV